MDKLTVPVNENNGWTVIVDVPIVLTVVASEEGAADKKKSGRITRIVPYIEYGW